MTNPAPPSKRRFTTRFLRIGDIPALLDLERKQWTDEQSATAEDFRARIAAHPELCNGAFCLQTGELLASLFCKPTTAAEWVAPGDWAKSAALQDCAGTPAGRGRSPKTGCLFGISLTSIDAGAATQLIAFMYLFAVKRGDRQVYLGSPMPGLKRHLEKRPDASVHTYARTVRSGLPLDPQLRYYHGKGFNELVAVRADYFPHEASCNYGAILKTKVPYVRLQPLVRFVPVPALRRLSALAPRFAIPEREKTRGAVHRAPEAA